jgi:molybdopterin-guanine dinucleotide biosynthesis protein A
MTIGRERITGLVLAGGRGSRMGGADKGLQLLAGAPLVVHAIERLRPQVGAVLVNANRNAEAYGAFGVPVIADAVPGFAGPLAGMLAGLTRCATDWLATVPCDSPHFPADLVERLARAAESAGAEVAIAATREVDGRLQPQPVFCLLATTLRQRLADSLAGGQRKIDRFTAAQRQVVVEFDDPGAFANANTPDDLARLDERG